MKLKYLYLVWLFASVAPLNAQSILTDNSYWTIAEKVMPPQPQSEHYYYHNLHLKDSLQINGMYYRILLFNTDTVGYLRKTGQKVYLKFEEEFNLFTGGAGPGATGAPYKADTSEFLLYDFGVSVGDTVNLRFDSPYTTTNPEMEFKYWRFQVAEMDSIQTQAGFKPRIRLTIIDKDTLFNDVPWNNYSHCYGDTLDWIAEIGSPISFLYNIHSITCQGLGEVWEHSLTCHSKDDSLWYQPYGICTGLSMEQYKLEEARVFPNPASDFIEISCGRNASHIDVALYDLHGVKLKEMKLPDGEGRMDLPGISSGIYLILLSNGRDYRLKEVFIK